MKQVSLVEQEYNPRLQNPFLELLDLVGAISGAVLDVYEQEPLPADSPLWTAKNVIMTPHMGCDDEDNYIHRCFDIFFENLVRMANGEELDNVVDRNLGY